MSRDCLDIGIIQAFLDGEIPPAQSASVSSHIAGCDACATTLSAAEDESAMVFSALEREFNSLVPTQRLWNRINDSITEERESRSILRNVWAFLKISLANRSVAAFASLIIVFAVFAVLMTDRTSVPADETTAAIPVSQESMPVTASVKQPTDELSGDVVVSPPSPSAFYFERASVRNEVRRPALATATTAVRVSPITSNGYLPGEESYIKTISSLNGSAKDQNENVLRPSERIAYESDMAVVNDTISKMRNEVRKNPKNESAKQVLYSSYQNKIDLLNSVARQEELVASLK